MENNLKKVGIDTIDEGRFVQEINAALENLQEQIIRFSDLHGDKAKGAKAKLTVEIVLGCMSPEDGAFAFGTQIKAALPVPPAKITMAMAGETDDHKPRLFARRSGTGRDMPTQRVLSTDDGRKVDVETGEVV